MTTSTIPLSSATLTGPQSGTAPPSGDATRARRTALVAGLFYLVTFASSIPALPLERRALTNAGFVLSTGSNAGLMVGGMLDLVNALAAVGTAVTLYPLLRQRYPGLALGFVTSRLMEAVAAVTSVIAILSLVTLHEAAAGSTGVERASLLVSGKALVAVHGWAFQLGPGLMSAINALLLGTMMYRSGLVPRIIPIVGLVGAPILIASATATIFGVYDQVSAPALLAALPVAAWELSLALWLTIKGFRPNAFAADDTNGPASS